MRIRSIFLAAGILVLAASGVAAQGFWEKKAYTEWSKSDCQKMLEDSPWSKKFVISAVVEQAFGQPTSGENRQTEQNITYTVQFRSVVPVRQAVVRAAQIANKYEKMPPEQKKQFDDSADAFLSAEFPGRIIVHVEYGSNVQFFEQELRRYWHSFPEGVLPQNVYLTTSSGTRVEPLGWKVAPGGALSFEFYFPRDAEGEPIIKSSDKSIRVEFPNPAIRGLSDTRAFLEFKLEKMKYKGEVSY